ncbi:hypothetical protein [Croceiramulus getboli]|nr:hypothetical protein P8624_10620 [Flavobacteriaceae bacterium YJPT1-3]
MKNSNVLVLPVLLITLAVFSIACEADDDDEVMLEAWEQEIEELRIATAKYENIEVAENEGFIDVSGFVPNMGHHFLLPPRADQTFVLEEPEILLYAPDDNGVMQFVAVEYIAPYEDAENPGTPPEGFTGPVDEWELNEERMQWQLHVWIKRENPDGLFAPFNPMIGTGN